MQTLPIVAAFALTALPLVAQENPFGPIHVSIPEDVHNVEVFAVGDFDSDGDADAIALRAGQDQVWINDGLGVFTANGSTHWPIENDTPTATIVGDLDGDGDLDVWVANFLSTDVILLNGGTGTSTAAMPPAISNDSGSVAMADVDVDGDLDVVLSLRGSAKVVCFNDGAANSATSSGGVCPASANLSAWTSIARPSAATCSEPVSVRRSPPPRSALSDWMLRRCSGPLLARSMPPGTPRPASTSRRDRL
ncbi:MAG: VCBS repeat-containing protein [Planctomycetota bacterium]